MLLLTLVFLLLPRVVPYFTVRLLSLWISLILLVSARRRVVPIRLDIVVMIILWFLVIHFNSNFNYYLFIII